MQATEEKYPNTRNADMSAGFNIATKLITHAHLFGCKRPLVQI